MVLPSLPTSCLALRRAVLVPAAAALALLGTASPAMAQAASAAARADPLDAQAAVPPLRFSSAFSLYRRMSDTPVGSWREANDTVTQIGGWRAYAREVNAPATTPTNPPPGEMPNPAPNPAPKPTPPGTGGAHDHGGHAPK